jgi:hypothetical protein
MTFGDERDRKIANVQIIGSQRKRQLSKHTSSAGSTIRISGYKYSPRLRMEAAQHLWH